MQPPTLHQLLDALKAHHADELNRRRDADEKRIDLEGRIRAAVKGGETSGDPVDDFLLCAFGVSDDPHVEIGRVKLRELLRRVATLTGQLVLVVSGYRERLSEGGCFSGPRIRTKANYRLGCLDAAGLTFKLGTYDWAFSTSAYATWSNEYEAVPTGPGGPIERRKGNMPLPEDSVSDFYGLPGGSYLEIVVGNEAVEKYFVSQLAHKGLAGLAEAIGFDAKQLPLLTEALGYDAGT